MEIQLDSFHVLVITVHTPCGICHLIFWDIGGSLKFEVNYYAFLIFKCKMNHTSLHCENLKKKKPLNIFNFLFLHLGYVCVRAVQINFRMCTNLFPSLTMLCICVCLYQYETEYESSLYALGDSLCAPVHSGLASVGL